MLWLPKNQIREYLSKLIEKLCARLPQETYSMWIFQTPCAHLDSSSQSNQSLVIVLKVHNQNPLQALHKLHVITQYESGESLDGNGTATQWCNWSVKK